MTTKNKIVFEDLTAGSIVLSGSKELYLIVENCLENGEKSFSILVMSFKTGKRYWVNAGYSSWSFVHKQSKRK